MGRAALSAGEQRRFAGVGQADQAGLGDQPEFEFDPALLAGRARRCDARRAARRGDEVHVALAALPPCAIDRALARHHQVGEHLAAFLVEDHRARRHSHHEVAAGMAVLLLAAARFAVARDQARLVFEIEQRREPLVDLEDHVAAAAAVAAGRTAEGTILFAQERDRAVAAFAGVHEDPRFIDKRTSSLIEVLSDRPRDGTISEQH